MRPLNSSGLPSPDHVPLNQVDVLLSFGDFYQFEHLLQEFEGSEKALFMAFLDLPQPITQRGKFGVAKMSGKAG